MSRAPTAVTPDPGWRSPALAGQVGSPGALPAAALISAPPAAAARAARHSGQSAWHQGWLTPALTLMYVAPWRAAQRIPLASASTVPVPSAPSAFTLRRPIG